MLLLLLPAAIARHLSHAQREALCAMVEGRIHSIGVATMRTLIRRDLVAEAGGAPTDLGRDVAGVPGKSCCIAMSTPPEPRRLTPS